MRPQILDEEDKFLFKIRLLNDEKREELAPFPLY